MGPGGGGGGGGISRPRLHRSTDLLFYAFLHLTGGLGGPGQLQGVCSTSLHACLFCGSVSNVNATRLAGKLEATMSDASLERISLPWPP